MAVIEELGGMKAQLAIPNSTPEEHEAMQHSYYYLNTLLDKKEAPKGRWSEGPSLDGKSAYSIVVQPMPEGQEPTLGKAKPGSGAQKEQI